MTTIDRVARAIDCADNDIRMTCTPKETVDPRAWARAAVKALRNDGAELHPLAPHLDAFVVRFEEHKQHHGMRESVLAGLNAMIDDILKEQHTS